MTSNEIVALRCPSCGEGITQPSRERSFGAEFRCDACEITSVLIVDRDLVPLSTLQKLGEKVCTSCGRIAQREARFCQEGHPLVRRCINSHVCSAEFSIDYQVCDSCGWPQNIKPGTGDAEALAFDRAVSDLGDPSNSVIHHALSVITAGASDASDTAKTAAVSAIHNLMTDSSFRQKSRIGEDVNYTEVACWQALGSLGTFARHAAPLLRERLAKMSWVGNGIPLEFSVLAAISPEDADPMLRQAIEQRWYRGWRHPSYKVVGWQDVSYMVSILATISPEDALAYCSRSLEEGGKNDTSQSLQHAVQFAFGLGKISIPMLEKFCGILSGRRGRACAAAITALRNGEKYVNLSAF